MKMTVVFAIFALISLLLSWSLPDQAGGVGRYLAEIYTALAVVSALLGLTAGSKNRAPP